MFGEDGSIRSPEDVSKDERGDDRVVQRTDDRDELRDQVERREEPRDSEPQPPLATPRDAGIAEQPSEQDDEVRDETRQLAGLGLPTESDEDEDRQEPDADDGAKGDEHSAQHETELTDGGSESRASTRA